MARAPGGADGGDQSPEVAAGQRLARPPFHPLPARSRALQTRPHTPLRPGTRGHFWVRRKGPPPASGTWGGGFRRLLPSGSPELVSPGAPVGRSWRKGPGGEGRPLQRCPSPTRSGPAPAPAPTCSLTPTGPAFPH